MRLQILSGILIAATLSAPVMATETEAAEPYVQSRDPEARGRALECLTQAIYYEARSESDDGQRAVAQVVLNRVRHPSYPNSVCGVVYQGSTRTTGCQFSFTCDGSMNRGVGDLAAWSRAGRIAASALRGAVYRPVGLALNYHTTAISPYWAPSLVPQTVVGAHIFYRRPGVGGSAEAFYQTPSSEEPDASAPVRFAEARMEPRQLYRPGRMRRASMELAEIPVVERQIVYRTLGARPQASSSATPRRAAARAIETRSTAPRVSREGGVRVTRGS